MHTERKSTYRRGTPAAARDPIRTLVAGAVLAIVAAILFPSLSSAGLVSGRVYWKDRNLARNVSCCILDADCKDAGCKETCNRKLDTDESGNYSVYLPAGSHTVQCTPAQGDTVHEVSTGSIRSYSQPVSQDIHLVVNPENGGGNE